MSRKGFFSWVLVSAIIVHQTHPLTHTHTHSSTRIPAPNLSTLFAAARETLFMKRPKAAFLLSSGFYLSDSMTVDGACPASFAKKNTTDGHSERKTYLAQPSKAC